MSNDVDERGWPLPARPWQYSDRMIEAMAAAAQIHAAQVRKGTTIPYLSHLLGACSIALDYGANGGLGYSLQGYGVVQTYSTQGAGAAARELGIDAASDAAGIGAGAACEAVTAPETLGVSTVGCVAVGIGVGIITGKALDQIFNRGR